MPNFKTTTRGMDKRTFIPDAVALTKMLDTVTNPDAADYAAIQIAKRLGRNETTIPVISKIEEYARSLRGVNNKQRSGALWTGRQDPLTDFVSLQQFLADQSVDNIKSLLSDAGLLNEQGELNGDIELDFAVNDQAQFVRGYKLNGKPMQDATMVEMLDDVFKAWLAEKGMFYKDGQLYQVDVMGKIMKNQNGQELLMNKEEIFNRLLDKKNGFAAYLNKQGMKATVHRRAFPETATEVERKQDVQEAVKHGQRGDVETAVAPEAEQSDDPSNAPPAR